MEIEQQAREKRIDVARMVEIRDLKTSSVTVGYTRNLSEHGVRTCVDRIFKAGELLELNMALENKQVPIKAYGEVVWCAPEIRGEYADVGFKFIDPPMENEHRGNDDINGDSAALKLFETGTEVTLIVGGIAFLAKVEEVMEVDTLSSDHTQVHLRVQVDDALSDANYMLSEEEMFGSQNQAQEKTRTFQDARVWFEKYIKLIGNALLRVFMLIAFQSRHMLHRLSNYIPIKARLRFSHTISRLLPLKRISDLKQLAACIIASAVGRTRSILKSNCADD